MTKLIVLVPGLRYGFAHWDALQNRLSQEEDLQFAHWLRWDHRANWFTLRNPTDHAAELRARIDEYWAETGGAFDEVVLVGHSYGGLLVRQAYLFANGLDLRRRENVSAWASRVQRIVLFASVNRGVDSSRRWYTVVATRLARVFPSIGRLVGFQIIRGSDFITNLRIQWIRYFASQGESAPIVVQLLGTRDDIVTREDSVDIEQFPKGYYTEISDATHLDLYRLDIAEHPEGRYALIRDAFVGQKPIEAQNRTFTGPQDVVFVIHGIRANNRTWVEQIRLLIQQKWPTVSCIGPDYGFVSALRFAIPPLRRRRLAWFKDAYSEALARNPSAKFNFIGHSNGTYLLGESLRSLPDMCFERVVLVGSVLPNDYPWNDRLKDKQVASLRVDCSCYDWPVGWLCSGLRSIGMKDVGTGGYSGFLYPTNPMLKYEYRWHVGGHSAPLSQDNLEALAAYAIAGTVLPPPRLGQESAFFALASRALRIIVPIAVLAGVIGLSALAVINLKIFLWAVFGILVALFFLAVS